MKRVIAVLLLAVFALGFAGCGSAAASSSLSSSSSTSAASSESSSEVSEVFDPAEHPLAICMGSIDHPVHRIVQLGFIESAEKLGYANIIISGLSYTGGEKTWDDEDLIEKWNNDIEENNAAGVAVWTGDDSYYTLLRQWHMQGVKIVIPYLEHDYDETHGLIDANPAENRSAIGSAAADYIVEALEENGTTHGSIGTTSTGGGSFQNAIDVGFRDRMAALDTAFILLPSIAELSSDEDTLKKVEQYISDNPDMVAEFSSNGGSPTLWNAAMQNLGRTDIMVVAIDYTKQNLSTLQNGGVDALIARPFYDSGYQSAVMLDELLRGTVFEEDSWSRDLGFEIVTADGTGKNGIQYYLDLWERSKALDLNKYLS